MDPPASADLANRDPAGQAEARLQLLYEAGKQLSSTLSASEVYNRLRELIVRQMACDGMLVSSFDSDLQLIRCEYAWVKGVALNAAELPPIPLGPEGTGMQSEVIRSGKPMLFSNVRERVQDERGVFYDVGPDGALASPAESSGPKSQTALMVPVKRDDRTIGVLQVMCDRANAYSDDDLALLEALITQMSVAIHNAALYAEARRQVDERAKTEARLRESGEMLRLAMRGGRMGAWVREMSDNSVLWSPELEELFGLETGGFGGTEAAFYALLHPEDAPTVAAAIRTALTDHHDFGVEYRYRRPSGEWRWMESRGIATYDEAGNPVTLYGIGIDINERKQQEARINELNGRLQRAMAESHHRIKNNLQVLSALVQVQIDDEAHTVSRSAMERMGAHVRALASLHELLTVRITEGGGDTVSLEELLSKLAPLLKSAAGSRAITLDIENVTIPLRQAGSFSMLVNELVSNAVKHGQGEVRIKLRQLPAAALGPDANVDGNLMAVLEVTDQGPGFPDGFNPRLTATTGMELITTLSTWDLQGALHWENPEGGGAKVEVTFPIDTSR